MSEKTKQYPTAVRTFADDIKAEKRRRGEGDEKETEHTQKKTATKPKAVKPIVPAVKKTTELKTKADKKTPPQFHFPKPVSDKSDVQNKQTSPSKVPNKIPSFHELQKQISSRDDIVVKKEKTAAKNTKPKTKSKSNNERKRPNVGYDATVITDTKTDRFKLLPAIIDSIKNWYKKLKRARHTKKTPRYVVPEASRRKGVIQRATSKTGSIFTADSETIKERIKRRHLAEQNKPDIEWSPYTEPGYELLESPDTVVQNVSVEYRKKPAPESDAPAIKEDRDKEKEDEARWSNSKQQLVEPEDFSLLPETDSELKPVFDSPNLTTENKPKPEVPEENLAAKTPSTPAKTESAELALPTPETQSPKNIESPEVAEPEENPPSIPNLAPTLKRLDTNTVTVITLLFIIGLAAIIFASKTVYDKLNPTEPKTISVNRLAEKTIIKDATLNTVVLDAGQKDILKAVNQAVKNGPAGLLEINVVSKQGNEVTPSYLFDLLGFKTNIIFRQTLLNAHFVSLNHSKPSLLLQFTDPENAQGGLLQWENNMPEDLRALFEIPKSSTLIFKDRVLEKTDARVLKDENGEYAIYGIVGDKYILIAPDTDTFRAIANHILAQS